MRRWLGNPIVVAALVLIAFIAVSRNIITPVMQDHSARIPAVMPTVEDTPSIEASSPTRFGVEWDRVGWPERIKRDPFRVASAVQNTAK